MVIDRVSVCAMRRMSYPALLWATVLIALLGSFQFGGDDSPKSIMSTYQALSSASPLSRCETGISGISAPLADASEVPDLSRNVWLQDFIWASSTQQRHG